MTHAAGALYGDEAEVRIRCYCQVPVHILNRTELKRTKKRAIKREKRSHFDTDCTVIGQQ